MVDTLVQDSAQYPAPLILQFGLQVVCDLPAGLLSLENEDAAMDHRREWKCVCTDLDGNGVYDDNVETVLQSVQGFLKYR